MKYLKIIVMLAFLSLRAQAQPLKDFVKMNHIKEEWEGRGACDTLYYRDAVEPSLINKTISFVKTAKTFPVSELYVGNYQSPLLLTAAEKQYIIGELNKLKTAKWPSGMFSNSKVLRSKAEADAVLRMTNKLPRKKANNCSIVYTFSRPIYLRNKTIAFYLEQEQYTPSETQLSFDFYRIENGEWNIYASGYIDMGHSEEETNLADTSVILKASELLPSTSVTNVISENLKAFTKQVVAAFRSGNESSFVPLFATIEEWQSNVIKSGVSLSDYSKEELKNIYNGRLNAMLEGVGVALNEGKKLNIDWEKTNLTNVQQDLQLTSGETAGSKSLETSTLYITCNDNKRKFMIRIGLIERVENDWKILSRVSLSAL
ncbi:hypothetical protein LLH06_00455 [Mucilaginibacter daejeonensis]|uniref:hypothetical protein n=1 Tax=Mucilaginibacter daejeonensis TaxID=398049 RepID=UPI001D177372|nr:hypothetical protein [Mucilaginibacter daejeonensis]UEG53448.1 hypothetical protein LLH06_00455 [Mucilaginibacter daejeonensis]